MLFHNGNVMKYHCAPLAASLLALAAAPAVAQDRELSEVIVTAAPYAVSIDTLTTSVNVLGREELDAAPAAGLGDLLNGLPGLRSSAFGPGASRPIVRGLSGPRVQVLQNGVGMVDASSVARSRVAPTPARDAIEVLPGLAPAYGGRASAGGQHDRLAVPKPRPWFGGRPPSGSVDEGLSMTARQGGSGPLVFAADVVHRAATTTHPRPGVSRRLADEAGDRRPAHDVFNAA